jgi:hypothetical protein
VGNKDDDWQREDDRLENNKEHTKLLNEILSRLSNLETITKLLTEVEKDQKVKMERLATQFHLYLSYVHHMDITPTDENGASAYIRKTRTVSQKEENNRWMKEKTYHYPGQVSSYSSV